RARSACGFRRGRASRRHDHYLVHERCRVSAFTLGATDGAARPGVVRTAHGELRTPAFMPVGTKATVKAVDPDELRQLGAEILLCTTYHLHLHSSARQTPD